MTRYGACSRANMGVLEILSSAKLKDSRKAVELLNYIGSMLKFLQARK